jgi:hypothetical protein
VKISVGANGGPANQGSVSPAVEACKKYLPAIGGSGGPTPDAATTAKLLQFAQCMRSHGISDFPDPSSGGALVLNPGSSSDLDPSNAQFKAAQTACQKYLPGNGIGGPVTSQGGGAPVGGSVSG